MQANVFPWLVYASTLFFPLIALAALFIIIEREEA
jgi:hypothetical protein